MTRNQKTSKKTSTSRSSRSQLKTISPPHSSGSRKKTSSPDGTAPSRSKISYEKNGRTDRVIDWLTNNVDDHIRLFSGSVRGADAEGTTPKTSKMLYYRKIACAIFENDQKEKDKYAQDPERYAKSVENHIRGLNQKYCEFNKLLGQTGAGLPLEEIEEGSDLRNLIAQLSVDFPYWERLHGFWRTIPNFNSHPQSAEPGQDLAAQAQEYLSGSKKSKEKEGANSEEGDEEPSNNGQLAGVAGIVSISPPASPATTTHLFGNGSDAFSVASRGQQSWSVSRGCMSSRGRLRSSAHGTLSHSSSSLAAADDDISALATIAGKKLDRQIAEQTAKRAKYESVTVKAQAEMEMEKLKAQAKMETEKLKGQERLLILQYQREREKETHQLQLLQVQYAMQNPALGKNMPVFNARPSNGGPSDAGPSSVGPPDAGSSNAGPSIQHLFGERFDPTTFM